MGVCVCVCVCVHMHLTDSEFPAAGHSKICSNKLLLNTFNDTYLKKPKHLQCSAAIISTER